MRAKQKRHATMKEVAEHANVSLMTVSNYVNGRHQKMSAAVSKRVQSAIEKLGYRRNHAARNLRTAKQLTIGMIIVDSSTNYLADGYTTQLVAGVSNYLTENGFSLVLQGIRPDDFGHSSLIQNQQTDGLMVMLSGNDAKRRADFKLLQKLGIPLVVFMESFRTADKNVCFVKQGEFEAGKLIGERVLKTKPKSVAILVQDHNYWPAVWERSRGMTTALETQLSGERVSIIRCGNGNFDNVYSVLGGYAEQHPMPDTILGTNDQLAIAALKFVKSRELRVPEDVQITGFNAFGNHLYCDPVLTTLRSPAYEMGVTGAEEMVQRLQSGSFARRSITFPLEFVPGYSARIE